MFKVNFSIVASSSAPMVLPCHRGKLFLCCILQREWDCLLSKLSVTPCLSHLAAPSLSRYRSCWNTLCISREFSRSRTVWSTNSFVFLGMFSFRFWNTRKRFFSKGEKHEGFHGKFIWVTFQKWHTIVCARTALVIMVHCETVKCEWYKWMHWKKNVKMCQNIKMMKVFSKYKKCWIA